jgi:hypothetical protein
MPNLVDQIKELISILEVVDPEAAKAFRGGSPANISDSVNAGKADQNIAIPATGNPRLDKPKDGVRNDADVSDQIKRPNAFNIRMTADHMFEGIILAEVLGKPISKRKRFGRF